MNPGSYLDLVAIVPPLVGLWSIFRHEISITGFSSGSVARLNIGFLIAVLFDMMRVEGFDWAQYGLLFSLTFVFNAIGTLSLNLYLSPENTSLKVLLQNASRQLDFYLFHGTILAWLIVNILFPAFYIPATLVLMAALLIHPTRLFNLSMKRNSSAAAKDMLTILRISWVSFVVVAFLFFGFGASPPVLGITIPFSWELAFSSTSTFFFLMARAVTNPTELTRVWTSFAPGTIVKLGQKYIVLHDAGEKALTLLSASLSSLVDAGVRIVIADLARSPMVEKTLGTDHRFEKWQEDGKIVNLVETTDAQLKEKAVDFLRRRGVGTVYVVELPDANLTRVTTKMGERMSKLPNTTGLFLVEKGVIPKVDLLQYLQNHKEVQLLDLTTPKAPFSSRLGLKHSRLQGSTILLEYSSNSGIEDAVRLFLTESVSYGELSAVFTTKSTKLYRTIRGNKKVKIIAASSLVSAPNESVDGEIEIPDRELGLVTSIASDLIDTASGLPSCFIFDSIMDMVHGDHWEQVYSGLKQIIELLSVPKVTTMVLANQDILDPQFLGALKGLFHVLLKLDQFGLRVQKLPSQQADPTVDPLVSETPGKSDQSL